jgi:hypothetical protein
MNQLFRFLWILFYFLKINIVLNNVIVLGAETNNSTPLTLLEHFAVMSKTEQQFVLDAWRIRNVRLNPSIITSPDDYNQVFRI